MIFSYNVIVLVSFDFMFCGGSKICIVLPYDVRMHVLQFGGSHLV